MLGPIGIGAIASSGAGAATKDYELLDQFTTPEAAPLSSPRTCEPGPGTLTLTDASDILSISGGALVVNGTPGAPSQVVTPSITTAAGKILAVDINATTSYCMFQLNSSSTLSLTPKWSMLINSTGPAVEVRDDTNGVNGLVNLVNTPLVGTYSMVNRENGGAFFFKDTDLIWVSYNRATHDPVFGGTYYHNGLAQNHTLDNLELYTPSESGLLTEHGIATALALAPANNETLTGDADGTYRVRWTPKTAETLTLLFRRTDDDNTLKLVCDQAAGTIKLYERVSGADTEKDAGKTQAWSVGTQYAITVSVWETRIQTRVNNTLKHNTTSTVNQAQTGLKVSSSDATPTINEFVAWPRSVPDFPFVS